MWFLARPSVNKLICLLTSYVYFNCEVEANLHVSELSHNPSMDTKPLCLFMFCRHCPLTTPRLIAICKVGASANRGIEWSLRASSVFIFASTSSCQIFLASSEHFRKYRSRAASILEKNRCRTASTSSTS